VNLHGILADFRGAILLLYSSLDGIEVGVFAFILVLIMAAAHLQMGEDLWEITAYHFGYTVSPYRIQIVAHG
jgi:hypothetical protein